MNSSQGKDVIEGIVAVLLAVAAGYALPTFVARWATARRRRKRGKYALAEENKMLRQQLGLPPHRRALPEPSTLSDKVKAAAAPKEDRYAGAAIGGSSMLPLIAATAALHLLMKKKQRLETEGSEGKEPGLKDLSKKSLVERHAKLKRARLLQDESSEGPEQN